MDSLFRDRNDDPDDSGEGSRPSIDRLVAAFREAVGRRERSEDLEETEPSEPARPESDRTSFGSEPSSESPESPTEIIEETLAAFSRAEQGADQAEPGAGRSEREEPRRSRRGDSTSSPEQEADFSEADSSVEEERREAPETGAEDEEESEIGSFEDFGPAFRKALSERGESESMEFGDVFADANGAEESGEEDDSESAEEETATSEVEPIERRGDGLPPSEELEMSTGASSPGSSVHGDVPDLPARPASSFLWVTEQPTDDSAAVSVDRLGEPRAKEADAFLLRGTGKRPYKLLTRIRSHGEMGVYLKPVFWRHTEGQRSPVSQHVDGTWSREEQEVFNTLEGQASSINRRIGNLIEMGGRESGGVELRVLRFMATRDHEFTPQRTVENPDGFVYPKLTPLLERESESGGGELSQVLTMLDERRLLTGEFVLSQHACRNCGCAFLNFEEMCPHCGATEIDADDLVHHFRCAFTGALEEYKKEEGQLVCPKCDRSLKQIGVDYDKPSVVYTCRRCHEQFQDPEVQTTCYQCEHSNPPDRQVERQIKEYEVTALGEETATYGLSDSLLSILERESRVLDYATFQLIVDSEAARIERYQRSTSSLLLVRVTGLKQLRMELGQRSQEVIEEIATAFDNTLRSSDYLSSRDESLYLFLLTETDQSGARRAGERLEGNIEGVLSQNLQHPPELDIAVQPLRPGIDLDDLAERFLVSYSREPAVVNGR